MSGLKSRFRSWQKDHYNFMSPQIRGLWVVGGLVVELSEGSPFLGLAVRGVSVYEETLSGSFKEFKEGQYNKPFTGEKWENVEAEAFAYVDELHQTLA